MFRENNIECIVLVYRKTRKPYRHRIVYALSEDNKIRAGEKHVATLDPAMWIQYLLNSEDKLKAIEKLYV